MKERALLKAGGKLLGGLKHEGIGHVSGLYLMWQLQYNGDESICSCVQISCLPTIF